MDILLKMYVTVVTTLNLVILCISIFIKKFNILSNITDT